MTAKGGDARSGDAKSDAVVPRTSESGVRSADMATARRRQNTPPFRPLTPYQARLDVEMDDTAISKVRDPSVSIALGADAALAPRNKERVRAVEAAASVGVGVVLGALVVVLVVLVVRALGH